MKRTLTFLLLLLAVARLSHAQEEPRRRAEQNETVESSRLDAQQNGKRTTQRLFTLTHLA
jgi:hypothetical protein